MNIKLMASFVMSLVLSVALAGAMQDFNNDQDLVDEICSRPIHFLDFHCLDAKFNVGPIPKDKDNSVHNVNTGHNSEVPHAEPNYRPMAANSDPDADVVLFPGTSDTNSANFGMAHYDPRSPFPDYIQPDINVDYRTTGSMQGYSGRPSSFIVRTISSPARSQIYSESSIVVVYTS